MNLREILGRLGWDGDLIDAMTAGTFEPVDDVAFDSEFEDQISDVTELTVASDAAPLEVNS